MTMFPEITDNRQRAFLCAYSVNGNVAESAKIAEISRQKHYDWKRHDPVYAENFTLAELMAADARGQRAEAEAERRAIEGDREPVLYEGKQVMVDDGAGNQVPLYRVKKSDALLAVLLKGNLAGKYAHRVETSHNLQVEHTHTVDLTIYTDEELQVLARLSAKARDAGQRSDDTGPRQLAAPPRGNQEREPGSDTG
jgi:hypothetical protein